MTRHPLIPAIVLAASAALAACGPQRPAAPDPAYVASLEQWRAQREEGLRDPSGWLTVVGLVWLDPGENRVGANPSLDVVLPAALSPPDAGVLLVDAGRVALRASAPDLMTVGGEPVTERQLAPDSSGKPDVVSIGRGSFYIIERGGKLGVRVKDPQSDALRDFSGIDSFSIDPRYRVAGRFERFDAPREVAVPSHGGVTQTMYATGRVRFALDGDELSLEPLFGDPAGEGDLFFVFNDATSGTTTYGGGRFLSAPAPDAEGKVELDFNRATNPPCAFTPYATCPLAPRENRLPVAIEAGEKVYAGIHEPSGG